MTKIYISKNNWWFLYREIANVLYRQLYTEILLQMFIIIDNFYIEYAPTIIVL